MSAARIVVIGILVVFVLAVGAGLWTALGPGPMDFASGTRVALADYKGPNPTGVPAALANASLVKRGEYLAHAADCGVCHTARDGEAYAGGFAFTLPFGTIFSPNITPDKETGIGNYSDADFLNAVRRGIRPGGTHLYPAMPFTAYTYMTDADVLAIKAYLFSLSPVHAPARLSKLTFPFNQRWLMGIWSWFFNENTRFKPNPSQGPAWNRGAYLAEALAHCGDCHTPRNLAYALNNRRKFAGAVAAGWRAFNITSDRDTGVGGWSDDELATYISEGHARGRGTASGQMGEAVDESFSLMPPEDIHALVAYLRTIPAQSSRHLTATLAPPAPASPKLGVASVDPLGKRIFEGTCAGCHGWTGESPVSPFATLTGVRAVNDTRATNVAQIVISGTKRTTPDGVLSMPAFGDSYSDKEIAAVANYVTARFGAKGSQLTEKDIADLRRQTAQP